MIACIDDVDYHDLRGPIFGIIFLSTPHRGSEIASHGSPFMQMTKVVNYPISGLAGNMRSDLVQGLRRNEPVLIDIGKNFRNLIGPIKIASCFEKVITRPTNTMVSIYSFGALKKTEH
jgi:hypothetical protein